jgi:hypothetical protein
MCKALGSNPNSSKREKRKPLKCWHIKLGEVPLQVSSRDRAPSLVYWIPKFVPRNHTSLTGPELLPVLILPDASTFSSKSFPFQWCLLLELGCYQYSRKILLILTKWWITQLSYSFILEARHLSMHFIYKTTQKEWYKQIIKQGTVSTPRTSVYVVITDWSI